MRTFAIITLCLLPTLATATPVQFTHQGRVLDAAGGGLNDPVDLTISLCPNATPTIGESCHTETFDAIAPQDGYFAVLLGESGSLDHTFFDVPNLWIAVSMDGGASEFSSRQPIASFTPRTGMLFVGGPSGACSGGANEGAVVYDDGALKFCDGSRWRTVSTAINVVQDGPTRRWSDGTYAASCDDYIRSEDDNRQYAGDIGSGVYTIDVDNTGSIDPFAVYCDMEREDGGWTLLLNLDTSDGHVMWWGASEWTNTSTYGTVDSTPFSGDFKSKAYSALTGTSELLLTVHEQGTTLGWKQFTKANGNSLHWFMGQGDNTPLATSVIASDTGGVWDGERLVRTSTTLTANRCIQTGGGCTTNNGGSPDGDRISSPQATPSNNNGGGLGNWHDMNYCCSGTLAGHTCNGETIRTASEAQAGWTYSGQHGTFGSDSLLPMSGTQTNSSCGHANWASANTVAYDYALFVR